MKKISDFPPVASPHRHSDRYRAGTVSARSRRTYIRHLQRAVRQLSHLCHSAHYHRTDYPGHFRFGERRRTVVARHGGHRLRFHRIFGILHLFQWKSCFPGTDYRIRTHSGDNRQPR